ncbi:MAG: hypothetical protein E7591_06375 [Ruminococcaceae bacterium]|nr:hypothetical protein [Oscillospiraceae bacterium]
MNNLKKLSALLLCLAMLFVMSACGNTGSGTITADDDKDDKKTEEKNHEKEEDKELSVDTLEGKWISTVDINDLFYFMSGMSFKDQFVTQIESMGLDLSGFESNEKCDAYFILEFDEDEVDTSAECDGFGDYIISLLSDYVEYYSDPEVLSNLLGVSVEELEEQLAAEGTTIEDVADAMWAAMGSKEEIAEAYLEEFDLSDFDETFDYEIDDNKVIMDEDDEYPLVYDDGKLVLSIEEEDIEFVFEKE